MQKHVAVYMKHFDLGEQDVWYCEACTRQFRLDNGLDIHHINGRGKGKDVIENLMALCRKCHTKAHSGIVRSDMQYIHNAFMSGQRKQFLV
jgi:hypothetical protein